MRKITQNAITAYMNNTKFKSGNTEVLINSENGDTELYLHNNMIAFKSDSEDTYISTCGWDTNTTRERLNCLVNTINGGRVNIQKGQMNYTDYEGSVNHLISGYCLVKRNSK